MKFRKWTSILILNSLIIRSCLPGKLMSSRDHDLHHRASAVPGSDGYGAAAHHFQPLPDICQSGLGCAFVGGIKTGSVILHDDLNPCFRALCPDEDVKRAGIGIHAVFYGIFHNGLQCERRQTEVCKGRIVIHEEHILMLRLHLS